MTRHCAPRRLYLLIVATAGLGLDCTTRFPSRVDDASTYGTDGSRIGGAVDGSVLVSDADVGVGDAARGSDAMALADSAAVDSAAIDSVVADATRPDASPVDTSVSDAFPIDAAVLDVAVPDGEIDAARPDVSVDAIAVVDTGADSAMEGDTAVAGDAVLSEDAGSPDAGPPDAGPPDAGPPDAGPPDAGPPDAGPCSPADETCNGVDDDCDGEVDEAAICGRFIETRCRVWLGWADNLEGPGQPSVAWGDCPPDDREMGGDNRCVATRSDGDFRTLNLKGDVDENDQFGIAFTCYDEERPGVASWIETHCAVFLGHADLNQGPDNVETWGPCPAVVAGDNGAQRCTSSGFDGRFRPMTMVGNVNDDDDFGVAFICRDESAQGRAAHVAASVEFFLGWEDLALIFNGNGSWGDCPDESRDMRGSRRCIGTHGDERFHRLDIGGPVDGFDQFGISLRAR